jgi:hypothetical protein
VESEVIGFGGDEFYSSDGEDIIEPEENGVVSDDDVGDGEEDRALQKLTRTNTDFNTVAANLLGTGSGETKRTYTQLSLGKPLTDAEGRRKTLQVSVTPFGGQEESDVSSLTSGRKSHLGKQIHEQQDKAKKITQLSFGKHSEIPNEKTGEIVLKSVVKNTETKQEKNLSVDVTNGENTLKQADMGTKKSFIKNNGILHQNSRDIILKSLVKSNGSTQTPDKTAAGAQDEKNTVDITLPKESKNKAKEAEVTSNKASEISLKFSVKNIRQTARENGENTSKPNENETPEGKASRIPVIKSRVSPEKLKVVSRTSAFNGRSDLSNKLQETLPKPAVRRSSYESVRKIENTIKKDSTNLVVKSEGICKDSDQSHKHEDISNHSVKEVSNESSEASPSSSVFQTESKQLQGFENLANRRDFSVENLSKPTRMTEVDYSVKDSDMYSTSAVIETHNLEVDLKEIILTPTADESEQFANCIGNPEKRTLSSSSNSESISKEMSAGCQISPVKEETCKNLADALITENEVTKDTATLPVRKIEGESLVNNPVNLTTKAEDFSNVNVTSESLTEDALLKEKDVEMFCVEESRELAGEPDGRADPDELTEPPALPRSHPPVIDPRPSFLHALTQVNALRKTPGDKPKIPVKPSTKVLQAAPRRHVPQSPKQPKRQENPQLQEGHSDTVTQLQEQTIEVKLGALSRCWLQFHTCYSHSIFLYLSYWTGSIGIMLLSILCRLSNNLWRLSSHLLLNEY